MSERPTERGGSRPTTRPTMGPGHDDTAVRPVATGVQDRVRAASADARAKVAERAGNRWSGGGSSAARGGDTVKRPAGQTRRTTAAAPAGKVRRARLRLTRVDPWSVMKTAFLLSIAFGIVLIVSVFMVWSVLSAAGVWQSINETVQSIVGGQDATNFDVEDYLGTGRVLGFTMLVAVVDVVLLTAMATLGAFLYNMAAQLLGGIEVTLSEDH